jgi:hypothetical protein
MDEEGWRRDKGECKESNQIQDENSAKKLIKPERQWWPKPKQRS